MNDIDVIILLLPIAAVMLVCQTNPYHALIIRGILGAIAALLYAILGAGDVALTEALMGTLLAITLYAVTVRSSLVLRLGAIEGESISAEDGKAKGDFSTLIASLRSIFGQRYMRVEVVPYTNNALHRALMDKEIHAACTRKELLESDTLEQDNLEPPRQPYCAIVRVKRLYNILQAERSSSETVLPDLTLNYISVPENAASENSASQEKPV
jgi:putative multicomponent Na+:H+ antiporter subunit B